MNTKKTRECRPIDGLVQDLIEAACNTLSHDVDILDGLNDYEISNRKSLEKDFYAVLRKYGVSIGKNKKMDMLKKYEREQ